MKDKYFYYLCSASETRVWGCHPFGTIRCYDFILTSFERAQKMSFSSILHNKKGWLLVLDNRPFSCLRMLNKWLKGFGGKKVMSSLENSLFNGSYDDLENGLYKALKDGGMKNLNDMVLPEEQAKELLTFVLKSTPTDITDWLIENNYLVPN